MGQQQQTQPIRRLEVSKYAVKVGVGTLSHEVLKAVHRLLAHLTTDAEDQLHEPTITIDVDGAHGVHVDGVLSDRARGQADDVYDAMKRGADEGRLN
jgi:phage head maturation protease